MGFFLVFFPEEQHHFNSSKPTSSPTINSILKRTNSSHIFTRAQSTISICALLIFLTLLLFTLSSFEPNNDFISSHRKLTQNHPNFHSKSNSPALQGLGTLYTRGTTAMNDLVICHVSNLVTTNELSLFLKTFHRSGLPSKSDLLFIFDSISTIDSFDGVIRDENDVFLNLVQEVRRTSGDIQASFDVTRFVNSGYQPENKEPIWGRQIKSNSSTNSSLSYGSVVGFGIGELDPENSLSGFLDSVPISLRRWASYPMILGRVRRKFKRVMLVDVKEVLLLGDPLSRVKSHSPESIFLYSTLPKHGRKSNKSAANVALIIGGERGVRRLSVAMLTEIVRSTTRQHHNKKNSITESALLSQLAGNEFLQKSIRFVAPTESIPDPSSLGGVGLANLTVVRRGNSNFDIGGVIMKHICSFSIDSSVYTDC
ncbi:hypothetical protein L1987_04313 [Smallanthus sonchifolius]|uniref:Uncharacterized protein n=1 Tax=Smallanthus sonchifolius TaxID=185202 RepID=A0ACB9KD40_9ASTR|nr:hypothetical protein L1987_04313 [Smallanthus sonchifolius]